MVAFLIAGVILGVLAQVLRSGPDDPSIVLTVVAGVVGALVGGVGINLVLMESYADLNIWSFGMACLLALVLLGLLEGGGRPAEYADVSDCVFCDIVAGEIEADVVHQDDDFVAFLDRRPVFKGHTLLVPRDHVETLPDLPGSLRDPFLALAQRLATAMKDGLGAQGSFVAVNNTVSQSVPHLHLHVVPRTKGDGLRGFFWPRTTYADAGESAQFAARIGAVLE